MSKNTKQRRAILKAFENIDGPLSIEEVLARADRHCKGIGIATIYRNLKSLIDEGTILGVDMPGGAIVYEKAGNDHHHHFSCLRCKKVFDVDVCSISLEELVPSGFELREHEILLSGFCNSCSSTRLSK
ncbi:MAG: transcriptional repressor [Candidatus Melainabacteria bacterium]|nr:transcriptional repressor [Candidatus Melainabacteria bacterium]